MTTHAPSGMRRRTVLKVAGAGAIGALAGCLSPASEETAAGAGNGDDRGSENESDGGESEDEANGPLTDHPYTAPPQVVDLTEQGYETTIRTVAARHQLVTEEASGGPVELPEVWAWQADDLEPSVPGPILRMEEGDEVDLHFENTEHDRAHTVHVHAVDKPWLDDGAPVTTGEVVNPGESKTYSLTADVPGVHLYHCHFQTHNHLDMGMYGVIHVVPEDYEPADREYFLTMREWDTRLHEQEAGGDAEYDPADRNPRFYTINGRSAPTTFHPELGSPLVVGADETVRVHVVNAGYENHAFHTHGHRFEVVRKDGSTVPESARYLEDVTDLAPAERKTIEFETDAEPGLYPAHCHKVDHAANDGSYPGGMVTAIAYEEAMDTEQFADVMEKAGYEE